MNEKLNWLRARQAGVGSSDSPVLALGEVFKHTPVDLYISKKKTITAEEVEAEGDNPNFRRGHTYEPLAAAMFEMETGIKVYSPQNDEERYHTYKVKDPGSPLFADFDGFCDDGWVLEIKSPMQRIADSFRTSGIRDYYMIQAQHLAHCANVCSLPFLGSDSEKWFGKVKGTRVVIYEVENVALQIIELPIDHDMIGIIRGNAIRFWNENVLPGVPPKAQAYDQPVIKKGKAKYEQLPESPAWKSAVATYKLAKERELAAARAMDAAKKMIQEVMDESNLDAVQVGFHKFAWRPMAGRKTFSKTLLQADYPDMDLSKYEVQGESYKQFNYYGPKDRVPTGDDQVDGESSLMTIQVELREFAKGEFTLEQGMEAFDELRSRADLYAAVLEMELGEIQDAITQAADAVTKKLG